MVLDCTVQCSTEQYTVHSWSQSQLCGLESNNRAVDADQPTVTDTEMYPKDTSSEDPGPPPASEGGAGGVQTESGMRRSLFGQTQAQPSGSSPSLSEGSSGRDHPNNVNITVAPFTGGPFQVKISKMETVEELKKLIARRLKVSKEPIYLLYRER